MSLGRYNFAKLTRTLVLLVSTGVVAAQLAGCVGGNNGGSAGEGDADSGKQAVESENKAEGSGTGGSNQVAGLAAIDKANGLKNQLDSQAKEVDYVTGAAKKELESTGEGRRHHSGKKRRKNRSKASASRSGNSDRGASDKGSVEVVAQAQPSGKTTRASSSAPVSDQSMVTLATWNLENFFDTVDDPYEDEVLSQREYADKLGRVSAVLQEVDADIVGVEEIENDKILEEVSKRSGYPYFVLVPGNDKFRGINVGVLSKVPIRNYVSHAGDRFSSGGKRTAFSRDCLEVHFKHKSNLTLLANHFKSKRGGDQSDPKRLAQATRVKEIAESLKNYPVAICGDLNDTPNAKTLRPLLQTAGLTDVLGHLPESSRLSFFSKRYQSALDYIIVNDKLKPAVVKGSAKVCSDIPNISKASDHRPVKVTLNLDKI